MNKRENRKEEIVITKDANIQIERKSMKQTQKV